MRPIAIAIAFTFAVGACADPTPSPGSDDSGDTSDSPSLSGQTGQSGTMPPSCAERDPETSIYGYADVTPLGFSVEEALAPMLGFSSQLTWDVDGSTTPLNGALGVDIDALNIVHDPAAGVVRVCVEIALATDDDRMNATLMAAELAISAVGVAAVSEESNAIHHLIDPLVIGGVEQAVLLFDLGIDQGDTSGTLEWRDYDTASWSLGATW